MRKLFAPRALALVGATDDLSKFGGRCLKRMIDFGYRGEILPINARAKTVAGRKAYASVRDVPVVPDHVGIAVPAAAVPGVLEDCAARGVPFATVFTGGFGEAGTDEGRALQDRIVRIARDGGIRLMGPNCNGLINFVDGFALTTSATIAGPRRPAGRVGIVSQSGGAGQVNVMWRAMETGLHVSYEVSFGNAADLDALDYARFMIEDDASDIVLMLAERIPGGAKLFEVAALAAAREKPIVVLKLGRTAAGREAAASHTGSLTGDDDVHDCAFRQCGVIRVDDCNELYETAMLLLTRRWPRSGRCAATTISGGNGVLLVDLGAAHGLSWPTYTAATRQRLAQWLPKLGTTANPTDVTNAAIGQKDLFRNCVGAIAEDDNIDVVVPILTMSVKSDVMQIADAAKSAAKPVAVLWTGGCNDDAALTPATLIAQGVPVYRNTLACVKAIRRAVAYGRHLAQRGESGVAVALDAAATARARGMLAPGGTMTERASKAFLAALGLSVTRERLARTADEAVAHARDIGGPVALKVESADIAHKTESGAIRLGIAGASAVRAAHAEVLDAALAYKRDARVEGVLVQEMVGRGVEIMLGVARDPVFGPVIVAGLGGVHVEALRDLAYRVAPVTRAQAHEMLRELRGYRILEGVRGAPPADVDALAAMIERLSRIAVEFRDAIREIDLNPVVAGAAGVKVVDALIVCGDAP